MTNFIANQASFLSEAQSDPVHGLIEIAHFDLRRFVAIVPPNGLPLRQCFFAKFLVPLFLRARHWRNMCSESHKEICNVVFISSL
jgi:hypothetical protein